MRCTRRRTDISGLVSLPRIAAMFLRRCSLVWTSIFSGRVPAALCRRKQPVKVNAGVPEVGTDREATPERRVARWLGPSRRLAHLRLQAGASPDTSCRQVGLHRGPDASDPY